MYDLHATILHLMGLDHERLTFRFGGRDFRLTDVYGRVIGEIIGCGGSPTSSTETPEDIPGSMDLS